MKNLVAFPSKSLAAILTLSSFQVIVCTPVMAADTATGWKVEVGGLRVVAPAPDDKMDLRAFNWSSGVTVSLLITAPQGNIVSVVRDESKITSFTDDKGKDLMNHNDFNGSTFSTWFSSSSEAKKSVVVEADGSGQPTKNATQLNISGKVVVQTATQTKELSADNVELKLGSQFNLGDLKLTVSAVRLHGKEFGVTLEAKQDLSGISQINFYDATGAKIESHRDSSSSFGMQGEMTYNWEFVLKKQTDKAKITATVWSDLKTTEVPVSVKVGLGL